MMCAVQHRSAHAVGSCGVRAPTGGNEYPVMNTYRVMKKTAYFVITARGGIYDEHALQEVLQAERIAGAGLDVFQQEPPPPDHPLLNFENVIVSPHNAGITDDANLNMVISAIDQWAQVFGGQPPNNLVNPDAWDKFQGRYNEFFGSSDAD